MNTNQKVPFFLPYLLPNLNQVLWLALFLGILSIGPAMMNIDGDLGRHITIGRYILDNGHIPTVDIFSHSMAGAPLTPHEWLSQVIFALADRILGLDGVVIVTALVIATAFGLVYRQSVRASGSVLSSLVFTIIAAGAASLHWLTRPHIFTFLALVIWVGILEDIRQGKTRRWLWMPLVMALWANLHGAFIAGFVVWILYFLGWVWETGVECTVNQPSTAYLKAMLLGMGASLLASLANPSGFHLWETSLGYLQNSYLVGHTAEYLSPDFHNSSTWLFLLLIVLVVFLFGVGNSRRNAVGVILVCAWMSMGLVSARNIPLFAIVAAPILSAAFSEWVTRQSARNPGIHRWLALDRRIFDTEVMIKGSLWPVIGIVGAVWLSLSGTVIDFQHRGNRFDPEVFPIDAVNWLDQHPQKGEVFNYFPWGGYILYREWPNIKVFIDGQTDFYGEDLTRKYETVLSLAPGWEKILIEYKVGWVIFPADSKLVETLENNPGWTQVYQDSTSVIFQRK